MADVNKFKSENEETPPEPQAEVTSESVEKWFCSQVADKGAKGGGQLLGVEGLDVVDDFSTWMALNLGGNHERSQSAVYILTMFSIMEIGEHVLGIGSGLAKLEMTGFHLAQIKESLKRIEGKMDKMLKTPLNLALDLFDSAITMIQTNQFKEALLNFRQVDSKAHEAFYYALEKSLKVEEFEGVTKALKLMMFSKIAIYSYDDRKEVFLPYVMLDKDKINLIGIELEKLVKKCLEQRSNVSTTGIFSRDKTVKQNKEKVQDILDSVLKVAYPYISQAQGWTDFNNLVEMSDNTVTIQVKPEYVPWGGEDATEITVGAGSTISATASLVKLKIWRDAKRIYRPGEIVRIASESDLVPIKVAIQSFVMFGDGEHDEGCLGQYFYDPEHDIFKQQHNIIPVSYFPVVYIYQVGKDWYAGKKPGQTKGDAVWMKNETGDDTVPRTGWQYRDGGKWQDDKSVQITPGKMTPCEEVTLVGEGEVVTKHPDCFGTFTRTYKWCCGKPVLRNSKGKDLFGFGGRMWRVVDKIGDYDDGIESTTGPNCPADIKEWQNGYNITVTCSTHSK